MSNREPTETAAWIKTRARVLAMQRDEATAVSAEHAQKSAERDEVSTEHALLRCMLLSLLGGHRPT